jgi:hypothetical protein
VLDVDMGSSPGGGHDPVDPDAATRTRAGGRFIEVLTAKQISR